MAEFLPFCAVHYNQDKFPKATNLVSPPYDMVGEELKKNLMKEYYNYVHLILPTVEDLTNYKIATHSLFGWLMRDVLVVDKVPSYYIHEKILTMSGNDYKRYGIIGLLKLDEYGNVIKKSEQTDEKYINDRYLLQKETQCDLEPIFSLYKDREKQLDGILQEAIRNLKPILELTDMTGDLNRLYKVEDIEFSKQINSFFSDKGAYIVDGQHRYEAALKYRNEMRQTLGDKFTGREPFNFVMTDMFNAYDESTRVFPINRLIRKLRKDPKEIVQALGNEYKLSMIAFQDYRMERAAREKLREILGGNHEKGIKSFGLYLKDVPNRYFVMTLKEGSKNDMLDVDLLDSSVIGPVLGIPKADYESEIYYRSDYGSNYNGSLDMVKSGEYAAAFILNVMDVDSVLNICDTRSWLPPKSVNFYPKVFSGLTLFSYRYSTFKVY